MSADVKKARALVDALASRVSWRPSGDPLAPYRAEVGDSRWVLRLNDFPDEPLYTLFIGGERVGDIDDWPRAWRKPGR